MANERILQTWARNAAARIESLESEMIDRTNSLKADVERLQRDVAMLTAQINRLMFAQQQPAR